MGNRVDVPAGYRLTEIGVLPEEWGVVRLGDVVERVKGKKPELLEEETTTSSLPYLTAEYYRTGKASKFVPCGASDSIVAVQKNDIVLIWDGSNAGEVFTGLEGVLASTMVKVIPVNNNIVHTGYLFYYLKTKFDLLNTTTTGTTIPHVNKSLFEGLQFPLPPLSEQKKIASVLSAILEAKEKTEAVIEAARELKKSLMKYLFTYGPVLIYGTYNVSLETTDIGKKVQGWLMVHLGDIAQVVRGGSPRPKGDSRYFANAPTKIHWIKISDLTKYKRGKYIVNTDEYLTEEGKKKSRYLKEGTLVLTNSGTVGIPAFLGINGCIHDGYLAFLRLDNRIDKHYLYYYLLFARNFLIKIAPKGTQANLNTMIMKNLPVFLPPLPVQKKIADILNAVDQKIGVEENKKKALEELFKTLLNNLITGKIRVNNLEV